MRSTRLLATGALGLALALVPAAGAAAKPAARPAARAAAKPAAKPSDRLAAPKPARVVRFVATGTLTAVDVAAGTVTVTVKGGTPKRPKLSSHTWSAATAAVLRDDAPATLGDLQAGDKVQLAGRTAGGTTTVERIIATSPAPVAPPAEAPVA